MVDIEPKIEKPASTPDATSERTAAYQVEGEVFIALVGAIGTRLDEAASVLKQELLKYGYAGEIVELSKTFLQFPKFSELKTETLARRQYLAKAIEAGNSIRETFKDCSAVMQLGISVIADRRGKASDERRKVGFILRSLKRPEEIRQAKQVYGSLFYSIAIYADEEDRLSRLTHECRARNEHERTTEAQAFARDLMKRDRAEGTPYGQSVRAAFTEADYFIRSDDERDVREGIARFLKLVFDVPYVAPTRSELAMMHARTASYRSVDLSRQVGAAIVSRDGRLLTTGCNEVPKAGGGQYSTEDPNDGRDFQLGYDVNDAIKKQAIVELIERLYAVTKAAELEDPELTYNKLADSDGLTDSRVDNLIEFGRVVHAENAAINSSCIDNISIRDCDLYCTTFPCHMCTRTIINVGIRNVFYIEPYPKSAAKELYSDSIKIDPKMGPGEYMQRVLDSEPKDNRVYFIPFEGCAPRRFDELFRYGQPRKDKKTGKSVPFDHMKSLPRQAPLLNTYLEAEKSVLNNVNRVLAAETFSLSSKPPDGLEII